MFFLLLLDANVNNRYKRSTFPPIVKDCERKFKYLTGYFRKIASRSRAGVLI